MLTQSQVDISNLALMQLGMRPIQSLADQNDANARTANLAWPLALGVLSRETPWNCLKKRLSLTALAPAPDAPAANPDIPPGTTNWAPSTNYAVNAYVLFGGTPAYLYQCLIANTSGASFTADLTKGYWFQTDIFSPSYLSPQGNASQIYEWSFAYQLPPDFILLLELNGQNIFYDGGPNTFGSLYEIFQSVLYCNSEVADIKYNRLEQDTTLYDTMFIDALVFKLAALMATTLRKDDATLALRMTQMYQAVVTRARVKNGNEANARRYSVVAQSRFVGARWRSTNG
jgi:hypothetical protein